MNINDMIEETKATWHLEPGMEYSKKDIEMLYVALALGGETGELSNLVKKFFRKKYYTEGHNEEDAVLLAAIADEIADVLYYTSRMAEVLGVDMEKSFTKKMEENKKRYGTISK